MCLCDSSEMNSNLDFTQRCYIFHKYIHISRNKFQFPRNQLECFKYFCSLNFASSEFRLNKHIITEVKCSISPQKTHQTKVSQFPVGNNRLQNVKITSIWFDSQPTKFQLLKNLNYPGSCDKGNCLIISFETIARSAGYISILFDH